MIARIVLFARKNERRGMTKGGDGTGETPEGLRVVGAFNISLIFLSYVWKRVSVTRVNVYVCTRCIDALSIHFIFATVRNIRER